MLEETRCFDAITCTIPSRHLLVSLIALAELAKVATTPCIQSTSVGDGGSVEPTARDKADAFATHSLDGMSRKPRPTHSEETKSCLYLQQPWASSVGFRPRARGGRIPRCPTCTVAHCR
jgi:hypothetical protein